MDRVALEELDDESLVRLIVENAAGPLRRDASSVLFGRYLDRVYAWCLRYVRHHEQALDLSQDVLSNAWRALDRFDGRVPFGGWLFVIARNRCFRALRPASLLRDEDAELESVADPAHGPDELAEARQSEEAVLKLMREHLEPLEQDALWLRCYEGMPVEEITRMLNLSTASGARGLLQSARRKLRAALAHGRGRG